MENKNDLTRLLEAATLYYDGKDYSMSDKEYDELLLAQKLKDPSFDIFEAIDYVGKNPEEDGLHSIDFPEFNKYYIKDDMYPNEYVTKGEHAEFFEKLKKEQKAKWYCKYDGCSLILYYDPRTGILDDIITRSNEVKGKRRYENFVRLVPKKIPKGIRAVLCEVMVPLKHGFDFTSRNKANGLTSSKYKKDEIMEMCTVIGCGFVPGKVCTELEDGKSWRLDTIYGLDPEEYHKVLHSIPMKVMDGRISFYPAPEIDITKMDSYIVKETVKDPSGVTSMYSYRVDGVVLRQNKGYAEAYKAYCLEKVEAVVEGIWWNHTELELKVPNIGIPPTEIEGTPITSIASGGVNNLVKLGIDEGVKLIIGKVGMTIPQVLRVVDPVEEVKLPTCECSYKFTLDDAVAQGLLCRNPKCENKLKNRAEWFMGYDRDRILSIIESKPAEIFVKPINIIGFKSERVNWNKDIIDALLRFIKDLDDSSYITLISEMYTFTDTQMKFVEANTYSLLSTLRDILY